MIFYIFEKYKIIMECPICLDDISHWYLDPGVIKLPCQHIFHASCVERWWNRVSVKMCPYCKRDIESNSNIKLELDNLIVKYLMNGYRLYLNDAGFVDNPVKYFDDILSSNYYKHSYPNIILHAKTHNLIYLNDLINKRIVSLKSRGYIKEEPAKVLVYQT